MEKAIEIKRRAQRCILSGDLDGALAAYEKLVASGDPDPYYCVLLADLLHKKNQAHEAQKRYFEALEGYSKQGLYKNGIAVCKKMSRLGIMPAEVTRRLAELHALDGFNSEASLFFLQHAEMLTKQDELEPARASLQRAIELHPDNLKALERLGEVEVLAGKGDAAVTAWLQAAQRYETLGQPAEAKRWRNRAEQVRPGSSTAAPPPATAPAAAATPVRDVEPERMQIDEPREVVSESPTAFLFDRTPPGLAEPSSEMPEPEPTPIAAPPIAVPPVAASPEPLPELEPVAAADDGPPVLRIADAEPPSLVMESPVLEEPTPVTHAPNEPASRATAGIEHEPFAAAAPPHEPFAAAAASDEVPIRAEAPAKAPPAAGRNGDGVHTEPRPPGADRASPATNPAIAAAAAAAAGMPPAALRIERFGADSARPERPGLDFFGSRSAPPAQSPPADGETDPGMVAIGTLLREAQTEFQTGNRVAATSALVRAAQAYDQMGRYDSAAAIYRSLGHSTDSSLQLMMLWLKNCQRRDDRREAARVACDLGDRALNDGDVPGAREWFERARSYDADNEMATRRLRHLEQMGKGKAPVATAPVAPAAAVTEDRFVNITTERAEPVIIDLGTLIQEFQRGVGSQLDSDPQGHYDLGMSYREMGLLEPSIDSFRIASQDPKFFLRSKELIGRCLLDLGHFDEAAEELRQALNAPDLRPAVSHDLRYQLGLALEAAGRSREALEEFERVYTAQANYPDVAMKIRVLRKTVESR